MVEKEYHVFTRTSKRRSRRGQEGHCLQADECQQCASNVRTLRLLLMPSFDGCHCVPEQQQCRAGAVVGGVWQISPIITHHISLRNAALPAWEPHNNQPATSTDWLIRVLPIEFQPYFDADILSTRLIKFLQQESNSFPLDTFVRLAESKAKKFKLKDTRLPVLLLHKTMDIVDHHHGDVQLGDVRPHGQCHRKQVRCELGSVSPTFISDFFPPGVFPQAPR